MNYVINNNSNENKLKIRKRDIYKDSDYDWVIKLSQRLKRTFIKFCKKHNLKSQKHYKIDWLIVAINLGQCPGNKTRKWNIDHIDPISSFNLKFDEQVVKCWHYNNLCWLPRIINHDKSDQINWSPEKVPKDIMSKLTKEEIQYLKEIKHKYEQKKEANSYEF